MTTISPVIAADLGGRAVGANACRPVDGTRSAVLAAVLTCGHPATMRSAAVAARTRVYDKAGEL
jgi:hypothetical protein